MRLSLAIAAVVVATGFTVTPTASADCTSSGGTTVCSQGDVRGPDTGQGPGSRTPYYPCWWCYDNNWGLTLIIGLPHKSRDGGGGGGRRGGG